MISYNPKSWLSLIFHSYSRQVMKTLTPVIVFMGLFSFGFCYIILDVYELEEHELHSTVAMHSLVGIVLGLFLVFRTNTAYDRWWEGRKHWGLLVNNTRNLSHKLNAFLDRSDSDNRNWFAKMIPNFVFSTKEHLRRGVKMDELEMADANFNDRLKGVKHIPNRLSSMLYERVNDLYKDKKLSGNQLYIVDKELKQFSDILGACERIKNTPIPYSYTMYIKKFIFIYILTLPFGFVTIAGYMTVPIVILISYVLLSVELIAEEIEDPFGNDVNDLPTDELSLKIKDNVKEILLQD
ncbi:MAG TPA: bestrophin family protein [Cyclobacteriaceae bacterium]|nr:bestrophin family protein [Cyclobacteriaceae bacterium]HRK53378.1 bestrophin family protein [Cyclobacteriaceae bacterium]